MWDLVKRLTEAYGPAGAGGQSGTLFAKKWSHMLMKSGWMLWVTSSASRMVPAEKGPS